MQTKRNKETIKRFETAINTADATLAEELLAQDAPFDTPAFDKPVYGAKGYLSLVTFLRASFPDIRWKAEQCAAEGNTVAVRWTCTGTHLGPFMGTAATGKKFSVCFMNFYEFNQDGKIIKDTAGTGMIGILQQLHLLK